MAGNGVGFLEDMTSKVSAKIANSVAEPNLPIYRNPFVVRLALTTLAVAVLWMSFNGYLHWRDRFEALVEIAQTHGVTDRRPALVEGMRRDAGPTRAALRLARALLADELDQRWILDLPADSQESERERGVERLDIAYELGVESLTERPGSWEALLVIGGAEYLRLARRRDQRLLLDRDLWLAPLEEAHRLAPLQPEPLRFLAAADLGNWSVLSDEEKERSIVRLESAFRDPTTFDLLSSAWLRVAPSLSQALAIVPDKTWAWSGLMKYFARRGDWERHCDARRKSDEVSRDFARARLDEAEDRLSWGDREKGVQRILWVGANTRPDGANVEIMERVLTIIPPGVGGEASDRWLRQWLDWSLGRCVRLSDCPLGQQSLRRLISLNRDLPPHEKAAALTVAGSLRDAEAIERRYTDESQGPLGPDWTDYMLGQARLLAMDGKALEALDLLSKIRLFGYDSILYWQIHREVASAAQDSSEINRAESWLAALGHRRWTREDWDLERHSARLELFPAEAAGGVALHIRVGNSGRGVLELIWDGSVVEVLPAVDGRDIELALPVTADLHVLEIRALAGASTASAEVRLLPLEP